jgi:hypothetical protein
MDNWDGYANHNGINYPVAIVRKVIITWYYAASLWSRIITGMETKYLDLCTDYLISTTGYARATELSAMLDGEMSHDQMTRFLSERKSTSRGL